MFKKDANLYNKYANTYGLNVSTYTEYKKNFFKLNIFYDSMEYTHVTLTPKLTVVSLLSNLGGSIGALLGFTIFTFFEALEIIVRIVYILIFIE